MSLGTCLDQSVCLYEFVCLYQSVCLYESVCLYRSVNFSISGYLCLDQSACVSNRLSLSLPAYVCLYRPDWCVVGPHSLGQSQLQRHGSTTCSQLNSTRMQPVDATPDYESPSTSAQASALQQATAGSNNTLNGTSLIRIPISKRNGPRQQTIAQIFLAMAPSEVRFVSCCMRLPSEPRIV